MVFTNLQLGGITLYPLIKPINGVKDIYSYQWGFDLTNQGVDTYPLMGYCLEFHGLSQKKHRMKHIEPINWMLIVWVYRLVYRLYACQWPISRDMVFT